MSVLSSDYLSSKACRVNCSDVMMSAHIIHVSNDDDDDSPQKLNCGLFLPSPLHLPKEISLTVYPREHHVIPYYLQEQELLKAKVPDGDLHLQEIPCLPRASVQIAPHPSLFSPHPRDPRPAWGGQH